MALRDDQVAALRAKLSARTVRTKVVNGFSLSYVEGWYTIAEANRIFGFDGWDRETVSTECVWHGTNQGIPTCSYVARVRVRVHAGDKAVTREGSGFGAGTGNTPGEAHEKAIKEAETDAMKRALATFGNRFGLCLYDKDQQGVAKAKRGRTDDPAGPSSAPSSGWVLKGPEGTAIEIIEAPQLFYSKARKMLEGLRSPTLIRRLWHSNEEALRAIRISHPDLRDQSGTHYTVLFARLCKEKATIAEAAVAATAGKARSHGRGAAPDRVNEGTINGDAVARVPEAEGAIDAGPEANGYHLDIVEDQSRVETEGAGDAAHDHAEETNQTGEPISEANESDNTPSNGAPTPNGHSHSITPRAGMPIIMPRRIRDKDHLRAVAAQPCVVCGRSPSHAHHLTFVQPRARGLKTSDEWVVPLCYLHHRELHDRGNEQAWWSERSIDPGAVAQELWQQASGRSV